MYLDTVTGKDARPNSDSLFFDWEREFGRPMDSYSVFQMEAA